jgi:hypothetical protein
MNWYDYFKEGSGRYSAPRCTTHLREPRHGRRQECSLGCIATRARKSVTNAARPRARTQGRGHRPRLPRFWRHETAPRRHQAPSRRHQQKAPPRNSAKGLSNAGARDRARWRASPACACRAKLGREPTNHATVSAAKHATVSAAKHATVSAATPTLAIWFSAIPSSSVDVHSRPDSLT